MVDFLLVACRLKMRILCLVPRVLPGNVLPRGSRLVASVHGGRTLRLLRSEGGLSERGGNNETGMQLLMGALPRQPALVLALRPPD
jgi:hypothetical protein